MESYILAVRKIKFLDFFHRHRVTKIIACLLVPEISEGRRQKRVVVLGHAHHKVQRWEFIKEN